MVKCTADFEVQENHRNKVKTNKQEISKVIFFLDETRSAVLNHRKRALTGL